MTGQQGEVADSLTTSRINPIYSVRRAKVNREPTIQLLPTLSEARVIRTALSEWMRDNEHNLSTEAMDCGWKVLADITTKIRAQ